MMMMTMMMMTMMGRQQWKQAAGDRPSRWIGSMAGSETSQ